jgi:hypothetical protein
VTVDAGVVVLEWMAALMMVMAASRMMTPLLWHHGRILDHAEDGWSQWSSKVAAWGTVDGPAWKKYVVVSVRSADSEIGAESIVATPR